MGKSERGLYAEAHSAICPAATATLVHGAGNRISLTQAGQVGAIHQFIDRVADDNATPSQYLPTFLSSYSCSVPRHRKISAVVRLTCDGELCEAGLVGLDDLLSPGRLAAGPALRICNSMCGCDTTSASLQGMSPIKGHSPTPHPWNPGTVRSHPATTCLTPLVNADRYTTTRRVAPEASCDQLLTSN